MMPAALLILLENNLHRVGNVFGYEICAGVRFGRAVAGLDQDRSHARVPSAADIAGLIAYKKRTAQVQMMIALRFEYHAGSRFSPNRPGRWQIRAIITAV